MPTLAEAAECNSSEKPTTVDDGTKCDVYRNLQRKALSVRSRESDTYGIVVAHVDEVLMRNVTFEVSESQRDKVRETGRKNVHAVVRGVIDSTADASGERVPVFYDPEEYDWFVNADTGEELHGADVVGINLTEREFYAVNPTYRDE